MRAWRILCLVGLIAIVLSGIGLSAGPAKAGFFDEIGEIFGGGSRRYERYEREPMYIKVYPRRQRSRPRSARRKAPDAVGNRDAAAIKAATIDPVKDPQWFLHDPTLRRGDIVVLEGRVLVFDSSPSREGHDNEDFVSLNEARSVPKSIRQLVRKMSTAPLRSPQVATVAGQ